MNRHRWLIVGSVFGFVVLAAMAVLYFNPQNQTVRIGVNDWPPCEVWYVAEAQGMFGNLDVELIRFSSWSGNMQAMYDGKTDFTHATWFNAAYFAGRGEAGTIVQVIDTVEGGDGLVLRESLDPARDLPGLRIAVEVNTDEHFLLELALADYGLTLDDIVPVALHSADGTAAFIAGEVDGVFTYDPLMTQAATEGNGRVVWTTREKPGYMVDVLVARNAFIDKNRNATATVVRAWNDALQWIEANPDEAMRIMAAAEGMPVEAFTPFFEGFTFFDVAANRELMRPENGGAKLREMLEFLDARGQRVFRGDPDELYTQRFLPESSS